MREIKFRAWDEQHKLIHLDVEFIRSGLDGGDWIIFKSDKQRIEDGNVLNNPYFSQQIKLMQFTGLQDKNGIDIYEGDIVKAEGLSFNKVIKYSNVYGMFYAGGLGLYQEKLNMNAMDFEVIGNIYQDPELLEKEK